MISYVLRLRPEELANGRFVGEVEAVASRRRRQIRTVEQITSFILATLTSEVDATSTAKQLASDEEPDSGDPGTMGVPGDAAALGDPGASEDAHPTTPPSGTDRRR